MIKHQNDNFILVQTTSETVLSRTAWKMEVDKALSKKEEIQNANGGYDKKLLKNPQYTLWMTYYRQLTDKI